MVTHPLFYREKGALSFYGLRTFLVGRAPPLLGGCPYLDEGCPNLSLIGTWIEVRGLLFLGLA